MTNRALAEEINWLRGFGWSAKRIADRLGCSISAVQKHIARKEPEYEPTDEDMLEAGRDARREARLVYTRRVPEIPR